MVNLKLVGVFSFTDLRQIQIRTLKSTSTVRKKKKKYNDNRKLEVVFFWLKQKIQYTYFREVNVCLYRWVL